MYDKKDIFMAQMGHHAAIGENPEVKLHAQIKKLGEHSSDLYNLRSFIAYKLNSALLLKQYEKSFRLFDCYENNYINEKPFIFNPIRYTPGILTLAGIFGFLKYKKLDMLSIDTYFSHINTILPFSVLLFTFFKVFQGSLHAGNGKDNLIKLTKYHLHSDIIRLNNKLRFDEKEFRS